MAHSSTTTNFNLPQFEGTDHPSFTGDFNEAFLNLDNFLKDISTIAEQAQAAASAAQTKADEAWEKADQGGGFELDKVYPVGSVFLSYSSDINPNTAFGGTWVKMQEGQYIRCTGLGGYPGGSGGSDTVALNTANLPSHTHSVSGSTSSSGSHKHEPANGKSFVTTDSPSDSFSRTRYTVGTSGSAYCIQAPDSGIQSSGWYTDSDGSHTHSVSLTSGATGSGTAFSIEPTFLTVDFWRRTA